MASPSKKPHLSGGLVTPEPSDNESDIDEFDDEAEDDDDEDQSGDDGDQDEAHGEIQVEFEARIPQDCDFHGIKRFLVRMFKLGGGSNKIDLSRLSDYIIAQRTVGSVISQSHSVEEDDQDIELDLDNEIYGVTTVFRLNKPETELSKEVKNHLNTIVKSTEKDRLSAFLENDHYSIGLLISERIMNIPPQISVPLYESLFKEINKAKSKNLPFKFTHYIILSKCLQPRKKDDEQSELTMEYYNAEEEILHDESDMVFPVEETAVQQNGNSDSNAGQNNVQLHGGAKVFDISQDDYLPFSKILIVDASKTDRILEKLRNSFPQ